MFVLSDITILHESLRGWRSHHKELATYIDLLPEKPKLIAINESFLNRSISPKLAGYTLIGRRDRSNVDDEAFVDSLQSWGGVLVFVLNEFNGSTVEIFKSSTAERLWFLIHCDIGPLLLGVWYRPPCPGDISAICTLDAELSLLQEKAIGTILVGDVNCHHARWLYFSAGVSTEGRALHRTCMNFGLREIVRQPTRGKYLLDVILTDLGEATTSVKVLPAIADHNVVLGIFSFKMDSFTCSPRTVWNYRTADWAGLNNELSEMDFSFMNAVSTSSSADTFTNILLCTARKYISQRTLVNVTSSHPWLSHRAREAILKKHHAVNTDVYPQACKDCSNVLYEEFGSYILRCKTRLANLPRGSKQYWKLLKEVSSGIERKVAIPALQKANGEWTRSSVDKAQLFATCFRDKSQLPAEIQNEYSECGGEPVSRRSYMLQLRSRTACYYLTSLDTTSSTGPDGLSTILLRNVARAICVAVALLARRIVETGSWPSMWKLHWIVPLYKRDARTCPANYRGLQLTSQLSKVVERFIGIHFLGRLQNTIFGDNQFAYRKHYGSRDALLFIILMWLRAFATGNRVGTYCGDAASAFDRVCATRFMKKPGISGVSCAVSPDN